MSTAATALRTPPVHRGMRELDRAAFAKAVPLLALRVPAPKANSAMKALTPYLLNWPRQRNLIPDPAVNTVGDKKATAAAPKLLLLSVDAAEGEPPASPKPAVAEALAKLALPVDPVPYTLHLGYEYWTADEILKAVLPEDAEVISAFETIGDIAHMNLREHVLEYKRLIAEVILDKNTRIATVVNKTSSIHTQFRTFPLEILASRNPDHTPDHLETTLAENGVTFRVNFATVYWNSRLHTEHSRLVDSFAETDLIADAMCGVGPFAIPAAKNRACAVVANDLNPESYRWLVHNIRANGISGAPPTPETESAKDSTSTSRAVVHGYVKPLNTCGRAFIRSSASTLAAAYRDEIRPAYVAAAAAERARAAAKLAKNRDASSHIAAATRAEAAVARWDAAPVVTFAHYVMNLPASALGFLDGFHGMWSGFGEEHRAYLRTVLPRVHVYCFTRAAFQGKLEGEAEDAAVHRDLAARIKQVIGADVAESLSVHRVRLVAPRKEMCCASFTVPEAVVFGESVVGDVNVELHYDDHESEEAASAGTKRAAEDQADEGEAKRARVVSDE
ncbi:tRNA(m(1)G37)methyltransferase [Blastocladiella emersonii ATCC 22665]|nr:tRNA(m(1)G37)methyltransferase [Blastocladiella emersonii ATCC 22665]